MTANIGYTFRAAGATYKSALAGGNMTPDLPALVAGDLLLLHTGVNSTTISPPDLSAQGWVKLTGNATAKCTALYAKLAVGDGSDASPTLQWDGSHQAYARLYSFGGDVYTDLSTIIAASAERSTSSTGRLAVNATSATSLPPDCLELRFGHTGKSSANNGSSFLDWVTDASILTLITPPLMPNGSAMAVGLWYAQQTTPTATSSDVAPLTNTDTTQNSQGITLLLKSAAKMAAASSDVTSATADLQTAINLAAAALATSNISPTLGSSALPLAAAAVSASSAAAALLTSINLIAALQGHSAGTAGLVTSINLLASAISNASAAADLSTLGRLEAAATSVSNAAAALSTKVMLLAGGQSDSSIAATLTGGAQFFSADGRSTSSVAVSLATAIKLLADAVTTSDATAELSSGAMFAAAQSLSTASADLATAIKLVAGGVSTSEATASLTTASRLVARPTSVSAILASIDVRPLSEIRAQANSVSRAAAALSVAVRFLANAVSSSRSVAELWTPWPYLLPVEAS